MKKGLLLAALIVFTTPAIAAQPSSEEMLGLFLERESINRQLNELQEKANKLVARRNEIQAEIDKRMKK